MEAETSKAERWQRYYQETGARPPRETLLYALDRFAEEERGPGFAVDLGCGNGRDTVELLRRGWRVLAVDAQETAIAGLVERPDLPAAGELETLVSRFEAAQWPQADLVNSSFALPLCPVAEFRATWRRIKASLRPGGRFSGHWFGPHDDWADDPTITHLERSQAEELLAGLEIEHFREEEDDTVTPRGQPKHWHIFHIVARQGAP
jgi:SAM-dependent methyltransferase